MDTYCKCDKQFGELSVYAWIDGKSVLIYEQCQKMINLWQTIIILCVMIIVKQDNEPEPENKKDEKLNSVLLDVIH